ncbi:MmgE/PrpD family protein [Sphingosinithalassobacter portus]|uniref:MmgE/PrpD family protein n=1 Tax=Stakelama portus TaxID=2676234 RepID=UPI000D6DD0E2|nr:MmgE/PrpD family protein [Sphingosinithalassobacter portus]
MTPTERILEFAAAHHALDPNTRDAATRLLRDTLAVGAAGATAHGAAGVRRAAAGWGTGDDARLLGCDDRLPAPAAAFVNAFQIHCLEWDAVHEGAVVHAMSVVTAALGAVIDRRGGDDTEAALQALCVGVEVACLLGVASTSALTFFRPATAGCMGAALALARIEGLDPERYGDVLGLAQSFCAGTMQAHVEGSVALPLQVANAARAAVTALDLVKAGLTGPHDSLEGPFGYFPLFDRGELAPFVGALGSTWRIAEISTKPFPSGRASHAILGALLELRKEGIGSADIESMRAVVPPLIARLVARDPSPDMSVASAQLCLPLLAALMLRDGRIDPRMMVPETFGDPALLETAARLRVDTDDMLGPNALSPQVLTVTLRGGEERRIMIAHAPGSPEQAMSSAMDDAKIALVRELAPPGTCDAILADPIAHFCTPEL